jgi:hypothetical protein
VIFWMARRVVVDAAIAAWKPHAHECMRELAAVHQVDT